MMYGCGLGPLAILARNKSPPRRCVTESRLVPEPTSRAMMIAGFALVGCAVYVVMPRVEWSE
jgi:hypothetical protein